jgi:hypothetical protein
MWFIMLYFELSIQKDMTKLAIIQTTIEDDNFEVFPITIQYEFTCGWFATKILSLEYMICSTAKIGVKDLEFLVREEIRRDNSFNVEFV